jgi:hypothetical protein
MLPNFKWILEILKLRARWTKRAKPSSKINFLASCSCTLILCCLSKPIHSTLFHYIYSGRLYVELYGKSLVLQWYYKWGVVKTRQASHGLTETHQKGHWKIMLYQGGGREKYTHFEIGGHVQMAKSDPEAQRKSSLSDCTWLERWAWILNLETLRFLMHFREPGSSLYFIFINSYIYISFLIHIFSLSFFHFYRLIFFFHHFLFAPLEL